MNDPSQPNPILSLVMSVIMAVLDLLAAFNLVHLTDTQKTAVITVATSLFGLGVVVYVWLKQQGWMHKTSLHLERERLGLLPDARLRMEKPI